MSLKQGKNKIPQSYLAKKEQLWLKAYPLDTRDPRQLRREVTLGLYHREVRKRVYCALPSITSMAVLKETIMNEIATQRQLIVHGDAEDLNGRVGHVHPRHLQVGRDRRHGCERRRGPQQ